MLNFIFVPLHGILMLGTLALTYDFYGQLDAPLPEVITWVVYLGVFGISVGWALVHALLGCLMGMAAGGIWDGLKLGVILGGLLSIGRLWPYLITFSIGSFLCQSPLWLIIVPFLLGLACLGIYTFTKFMWGQSGTF